MCGGGCARKVHDFTSGLAVADVPVGGLLQYSGETHFVISNTDGEIKMAKGSRMDPKAAEIMSAYHINYMPEFGTFTNTTYDLSEDKVLLNSIREAGL